MDNAQLLTWAEQRGYTFTWEDDWHVGSHVEAYGPGSAYEPTEVCGCTRSGRHVWDDPTAKRRMCEACGETAGEPNMCEMCTIVDEYGDAVNSMGCVDDANEEYRREIEAELAWDVHAKWVKAQRRTRSTWRARKRTLRRPVGL
jgi:hypothetical protein